MEQEIDVIEEGKEEEIELQEEAIVIGSGTRDYEKLKNKPQINSVELLGNKSFEDLGAEFLTNMEIEELINNQS